MEVVSALSNPVVAHQLRLAVYFHVGATAVLVWDVVSHLRDEYKLLFHHKVIFPSFLYFCSRISLLAYMIGRAIFLTSPIPNCAKFMIFLNVTAVLSITSLTALLYLRVCAVYCMRKSVMAFFGFVWLATVVLSISFIQTFTANPIGNSQYCIESIRFALLGPLIIILFANDMIVFLAITYRVYRMYLDSGAPVSQRLEFLCCGTKLPLLSRAILQDSQLYCLISVVSKCISVLFAYRFNGPFQMMVIICHLVLVNMLCCQMYRKIRLGSTTHHNVHVGMTQTMELAVDFRNQGLRKEPSMPVFSHRHLPTTSRIQNSTFGGPSLGSVQETSDTASVDTPPFSETDVSEGRGTFARSSPV